MGGQDGARICQNDKRRISLTARLNDGMDLAPRAEFSQWLSLSGALRDSDASLECAACCVQKLFAWWELPSSNCAGKLFRKEPNRSLPNVRPAIQPFWSFACSTRPDQRNRGRNLISRVEPLWLFKHSRLFLPGFRMN